MFVSNAADAVRESTVWSRPDRPYTVDERRRLAEGTRSMAARSNAIAELTRFWLQTRHGCLVDEAVPVKVPFGHSDIDLVALRPDFRPWTLPNGNTIRRVIVETKDEHDFDPHGRDFGKRLHADTEAMGDDMYIPVGGKARFSMLRQQHFERATEFFRTSDFDRLFVLHALDPQVRSALAPQLAATQRVHLLTVREVVADLQQWYEHYASPATLRHSLVGDLWHLLVGYCGLKTPTPGQ
jgi:hypothetical protein